MVHRALLLPEIVARILEAGGEEPGFLHSSLLVNRLFFQEASRVLWAICDDSEGAGRTHPNIHHLGALILREDVGPERAQFYANLVRNMSFNYDTELHVDQHSWHSVLRQVKFPQLSLVWFWETEFNPGLATEDALLHYTGPRVRDLHAVCGPLSDRFFDGLSEAPSNLRDVVLRPTKVTASASSLMRALAKMTSVESLNLEQGFRKVISANVFETIALLPKIKQLSLSAITQGCFSALSTKSKKNWFPKLKYLYTGAAANVMEFFHRIAPDIEAIGLQNEYIGLTDDVLSVLSRFQQLTSILVLLSASSTFRGTELLQVAQGCPRLEDLQIGIDSWNPVPPSAIGITDDLIHDLAYSLPNIKRLNLVFHSNSYPGLVKTLQILGRGCPKLEELMFSCRADWRSLLNLPKDNAVGQFTQLWFLVDEHMEQSLTKEEYSQVMGVWRENGATWLPQVVLLQIPHSDDWENAFTEVLDPDEIFSDAEEDSNEMEAARPGEEEVPVGNIET